MDFLSTYLDADEKTPAPGANSDADIGHYPSPNGVKEKNENEKSPKVKPNNLFLDMPKSPAGQDDDYDDAPIPTMASDLLTPMTGTSAGGGPNSFFSRHGGANKPVDSMRTVFLTPRITPPHKGMVKKSLGATEQSDAKVREESSTAKKNINNSNTPVSGTSVDSGPLQSMMDFFKTSN